MHLFQLLICFLVFLVPYLAFIVVFPGIREKRLATFVTLTLHLTVGALLTGTFYVLSEVLVMPIVGSGSGFPLPSAQMIPLRPQTSSYVARKVS